MKKTKVLMGLFACGMLLAACGNGGSGKNAGADVELGKAGEFPVVKEKLSMTMMGPGTGAAEWKDMAVFKTMAEKSNIDFCTACFTGKYPTEIPTEVYEDKFSKKIQK